VEPWDVVLSENLKSGDREVYAICMIPHHKGSSKRMP